ncbi:MAG: hypothetical protein ACFFCE_11720 [Promethearchaeota archaeon]
MNNSNPKVKFITQKLAKIKNQTSKNEFSGSETIYEKIRKKTPWIFGKRIRKPKIIFPKIKRPRMSLPLPPKSFIIIGIFTILFILQTGIIYLIIRNSPSIIQDEYGNPIFIIPKNVNEALIIESIVASILMILFSMGFVLIFQASKYVYNKKFADWILVIGILLIIIAFGILQLMLNVKAPELFKSE